MGVAERRLRERDERRRAIMEAAARAFLRAGYAGTNMNAIAAEAEIGVGTIYLHFRNKEEVLLSILKEGIEQLHEVMRDAAQARPTPLEALEEIARRYVAYASENPAVFSMLQYFQHASFFRGLSRETHAEWVPAIHRVSLRNLEIIEDKVREGQEAGIIDSGLTACQIANVFWAMLIGALKIASNAALLKTSKLRYEELLDGALRFLIDGMKPRARGPRPRRVK